MSKSCRRSSLPVTLIATLAVIIAAAGSAAAQGATQAPSPAAAAAPAGPVAIQEPTPAAGVWTFVPEASEQIDEKADRAVAHMNFLIRGIARGRLRGANEPVERIEIRYSADSVYITLRADEPAVVSARDGSSGPYRRADGEVVRVRTQISEGVIDQFFDSEDGDKRMVYRVRPDGMLALEVEVLSDKLREPFTYTWVFRADT